VSRAALFFVVPVFLALAACAPPQEMATTTAAPDAASRAVMLGQLGHGVGDVKLVRETGARILWEQTRGAPRVMFFGFTHCPVICPTTLYQLDATRTLLGEDGARIGIDFVTVDPARDTASVLQAYLAAFGHGVRGFTGQTEDIRRLAAAYRAAFRIQHSADGEYTVDHTTMIYCIAADGRVVDMFPFDAPRATIEARLRSLAASAAGSVRAP